MWICISTSDCLEVDCICKLYCRLNGHLPEPADLRYGLCSIFVSGIRLKYVVDGFDISAKLVAFDPRPRIRVTDVAEGNNQVVETRALGIIHRAISSDTLLERHGLLN